MPQFGNHSFPVYTAFVLPAESYLKRSTHSDKILYRIIGYVIRRQTNVAKRNRHSVAITAGLLAATAAFGVIISIAPMTAEAKPSQEYIEQQEQEASSIVDRVEMMIDDYQRQKDDNTDSVTTFERFINRTLGIGATINENGNYVIEADGYKLVISDSSIRSMSFASSPSLTKTFASVAAMSDASDLAVGDIVSTTSFHDSMNKGGAVYKVEQASDVNALNGYSNIELANGLVAVLQPSNGTVSIEQLGAVGDGVTDDTKSIQAAFDLDGVTVTFSKDAKYYITNRIWIRNDGTTVIGNGATLAYREYFNFGDWAKTNFAISIGDNETQQVVHDVYIQDLNVDSRDYEAFTKGFEHNIIRINYAENVELYGCDIIADGVPEDEVHRRISNIDLRSYWKDVVIDSCTLVNNTYAEAGGAMWIRTGIEGTGGLTVRNCDIEKSCHDEIIAVFGSGAYAGDITIENNTIKVDDTSGEYDPSAPIIKFGTSNDYVSNVRFVGNDVDVAAGSKVLDIENANGVTVSGNSFDFDLIKFLTQYTGTDNPANLVNGVGFYANEQADNLSMTDNEINVTSSEGLDLAYLANGFDTFSDNDVTIDVPFCYLATNCDSVDDNNVKITSDHFATSMKLINENRKQVDNPSLYHYDDVSDNSVHSFSGNKVHFNQHIDDGTWSMTDIADGIDVDVSDNDIKMAKSKDKDEKAQQKEDKKQQKEQAKAEKTNKKK